MERKWIIVAFGDISGFSEWRRRASNQPEIAQPFLKKFYTEIQDFSVKYEHLYMKYLGDGVMIIKEIDEKYHKHRCVTKFIHQVGLLNARLLKVVRACEWPSPEGFRMRAVCGHVDKIMVADPQNLKRMMPEYVGYAINLAAKLLDVSPGTNFLCHESVTKVLGKSPRLFKLKKFAVSEERRRGVDPEDVHSLWEVQFK